MEVLERVRDNGKGKKGVREGKGRREEWRKVQTGSEEVDTSEKRRKKKRKISLSATFYFSLSLSLFSSLRRFYSILSPMHKFFFTQISYFKPFFSSFFRRSFSGLFRRTTFFNLFSLDALKYFP